MKSPRSLFHSLSRSVSLASSVLWLSAGAALAQQSFIPTGSVWKFRDTGTAPAANWTVATYDDTTWASGPAELGYGDGGEVTLLNYGPSSTAKYITTWLRKKFTVANAAAVVGLKLELMRDDGAVVYINGVEVARSNMPTGTITASTLAPASVGGADELTFFPFVLSPTALVTGENVIAVELHQNAGNSSDLSFDLRLTDGVDALSVSRGPYIQRVSTEQATLRWRTTLATGSVVRYGTALGALNQSVTSATAKTGHNLTITGLLPDTKYYYSIGNGTDLVVGSSEHYFVTHPPVGTAKNTRIWVLGDSGTASSEAAAVRNSWINYNGNPHADLWLMLGDNAYNSGTDSEYQVALFNMYPTILRNTELWSTLGNHDGVTADSPTLTGPYYDIFSLPRNAESGGIASGTEAYYSFDYANVHFVCLDSQDTPRATTGAMWTWLQSDLAATSQEWIVAFFHHPPYTKGTHDSDSSTDSSGRMNDMRANFLPLLENYGVDLVLCGHSHTYERTYLLDGHYGLSSTLQPSNILNSSSGNPNTTGAYVKQPVPHDGAVYVVAGNGGHAEASPLNHPAMYVGMSEIGSLVMDVNGNQLNVAMLDGAGAIADRFALRHEAPPGQYNVTVDNADATGFTPTGGAGWVAKTAPAGFHGGNYLSDENASKGTLSARFTPYIPAAGTYTVSMKWPTNAAQSAAVPVQINHAGGVTRLSVNQQTYGNQWVLLGTYTFNPRSSDATGSVTIYNYDPVTLTHTTGIVAADAVRFGGGPADTTAPATPTGLVATAGDGSVSLDWGNVADEDLAGYRVFRSTVAGSAGSVVGSLVATSNYVDTSAVNGTTYYYTVASIDFSGNVSAVSAVVTATPVDMMPPVAPSGLAAMPGDGAVSLDWNDNAEGDLNGYRIYRTTSAGSGYVLVAAAASSNFTDSGLSNGTLYFYIVKAVDLGGNESAASAEVSATPMDQTPPAVPAGLVAASGDGQISLNWPDNSEADLTGYAVYRSLAAGSGYTVIGHTTVAASNYTDTGLTNGVTYYYVVTAFDATGNYSAASTVASAVPMDVTPPAAPLGLAATAGEAQVSLDWADSTELDFASYRVLRSTTTGAGFSQIATLTSSQYLDTTAANGITYFYAVTALDATGNVSTASNEASATPMDSTPPEAPTSLVAVAGDSTVALDWSDNEETDLASYRVLRSTTAGAEYSQIGSVATSQFIDLTAINGTTYFYAVTAVDATGNVSPDSLETSATPMDTTPPAAPTGLVATGGDSEVLLDWANNTEADFSSYRVLRSTTAGSGFAEVGAVTTSAFTDTAVANGTTYFYRLTAMDVAGNTSAASLEASATPMNMTDTTPPAAPAALTATAGDTQVVLNWADNTEPDFASYQVLRSLTAGSGFVTIATPAASQWTDLGLTNGVTYYYAVKAVDAAGNASLSSPATSAVPQDTTPPAAPAGLVATRGDQQVSLNWNDNTEPDLATYQVLRSTTAGSGFVQIAAPVASQFTDTGLTNGVTYYYVVNAKDNVGNVSANTTTVSATPLDTVAPPVPGSFTATPSNVRVALNWADSTATDFASFRVLRSTTSGSGYVQIATATLSEYVDTAVVNGTTYYYVVRAVDTTGNVSANSAQVSAKPLPNSWVSNIGMTVAASGSKFKATAAVSVRKTGGTAVSGATVKGQWKFKGVVIANVTGTTNTSGNISFTSALQTGVSGNLFNFTITSVTSTTSIYSSALNVETSDSIGIP